MAESIDIRSGITREGRSMVWTEDQIRTLLRECVRFCREHPIRPDGTYNFDMNAVVQQVLDEYYEPKEGWLSRLFDGSSSAVYTDTMTRPDILLWHDDVRPAPEGWTWVQTNDEAKTILAMENVAAISMDHDLGGDPASGIFARGTSPNGDGNDLARWMVENDRVPPYVKIHSWNPPGAARIANTFTDAGYECHVIPYELPR